MPSGRLGGNPGLPPEDPGMRPLAGLREGWDERRRLEGRLLRAMTVFQSVSELEALYRDFGRHLEEREPDLQERRARHLASLQERLARASRHRGSPEA